MQQMLTQCLMLGLVSNPMDFKKIISDELDAGLIFFQD